MKQYKVLQVLLTRKDVYTCPEQREAAKKELAKKLKRKNKRIIKITQTKLEL